MGKYKLELFTVVINGKIVYTMGTRKERLGKKMTVLATEVGRVDVSNLDFLMPIANFMTANGPHQRTNCPNRGSVSSQHMVQWTSGSDMQRTEHMAFRQSWAAAFHVAFHVAILHIPTITSYRATEAHRPTSRTHAPAPLSVQSVQSVGLQKSCRP